MHIDSNQELNRLCNESDQLIFTLRAPFDVRNRNRVPALYQVKEDREKKLFCTLLEMGIEKNNAPISFMSPVEIYVNFLRNRSYLGNVGIVDRSWIRSQEFEGDYHFRKWPLVEEWLFSHKVLEGKRWTE